MTGVSRESEPCRRVWQYWTVSESSSRDGTSSADTIEVNMDARQASRSSEEDSSLMVSIGRGRLGKDGGGEG